MNELSRNFQPDLASTRGVAVIAPRGASVDVMTGTEIATQPPLVARIRCRA
jgi:hypothetical protein